MTQGNDPINANAFDHQIHAAKGGISSERMAEINNGLTKREYFAAMAMQGLLTRIPNKFINDVDLGVLESKRIAEESAIMADELINALNKGQ